MDPLWLNLLKRYQILVCCLLCCEHYVLPELIDLKYNAGLKTPIVKFPFTTLLDFSLTLKAATLIFVSGCGSTIASAKEGKSGFIF